MSIILILFGIVFIWAGVKNWRDSREHFEHAVRTDAVVVEIEDITWNSDGKTLRGYRAIYAYHDTDGNEHRMRGRSKSTRKGAFTIGARKTVFVDPDFPAKALDTPAKEYASLIFALVAGVGMLGFGIAAWVLDWNL